MSTRRLFFALWPGEAMRQELASATREIIRASGGRPAPIENLHLTLAFLGSVPEEAIEKVREIATRVAGEHDPGKTPVAITLDRIDYWAKPQIVCSTASQTPASATELAERLKEQLVAGGFAPDLKPFRAHATLVRKARRPRGELSMVPVVWSFTDFALVESRTAEQGSLYSVLDSWVLSGR